MHNNRPYCFIPPYLFRPWKDSNWSSQNRTFCLMLTTWNTNVLWSELFTIRPNMAPIKEALQTCYLNWAFIKSVRGSKKHHRSNTKTSSPLVLLKYLRRIFSKHHPSESNRTLRQNPQTQSERCVCSSEWWGLLQASTRTQGSAVHSSRGRGSAEDQHGRVLDRTQMVWEEKPNKDTNSSLMWGGIRLNSDNVYVIHCSSVWFSVRFSSGSFQLFH